MTTTLNQILISTLTIAMIVALSLSTSFIVSAHSGLGTSDAGKAACNGTLGGERLSDTEREVMCSNYRQNYHSLGSVAFEVVKALMLVGLGVAIGVLAVRSKKAAKKKQKPTGKS